MWLGASLVLVAFVLFAGALSNEYVFDGIALVRDNPLLSPFEPWKLATVDWWEGTGKAGGLYRPVSLIALAALRALGEGGPALINLVNVALLGCVAWLQFSLLARLLGNRPGAQIVAWCAALIALVHPLNAEIVGGQVGLADLLATLLMCAAVLAASGTSRWRFVFAAALAGLAALSKESGVLVLPLALLFELLRRDEQAPVRGRLLFCLGWSSLGVGLALVARYAAIGSLASADDPVYAGFTTAARAASACATLAVYSLPLLLAPWRQLAVVSHQDALPAGGFEDPRAILGLLILLAWALGPWVLLRRGRREIAFGAWFALAAWLPTSNLIFSSGAVAASRFFYMGLFALALPLALLMHMAWTRGGAWRALTLASVGWFLIANPVVAWRETATWHSERALLEAQVSRAPNSVYGLVDLAKSLSNEAPARARELFTRATQATLPNLPRQSVPPEDLLETAFLAHLGAALLANQGGESDVARDHYRSADELAQRGQRAREHLPFREDWTRHRVFTLQNLGAAALEQAKRSRGEEQARALDEAQHQLDQCDACDPNSSETVRLRSILLQLRGDSAGRTKLVEEAWRRRPEDPLLRFMWANELRQSGREFEALVMELDVATSAFAEFDRAKSLAIAQQALGTGDAILASRARGLLERLTRMDPARPDSQAIAVEAARVLREAAVRGN